MPRVLVDIDGVIADSASPLLRAVRDLGYGDFNESDVTSWDYTECLGLTSDQEEDAWVTMANPPHKLWHIAPYAGAIDAVLDLRQLAEVVFVTAPSPHIPEWTHFRDLWLEHYFPGVPAIHTKHKHLIQADAIVDDRTENVVKWLEAHPRGTGVLFARPWNALPSRAPRNMCRTGDWSVIRGLLRPTPVALGDLDRVALARCP